MFRPVLLPMVLALSCGAAWAGKNREVVAHCAVIHEKVSGPLAGEIRDTLRHYESLWDVPASAGARHAAQIDLEALCMQGREQLAFRGIVFDPRMVDVASVSPGLDAARTEALARQALIEESDRVIAAALAADRAAEEDRQRQIRQAAEVKAFAELQAREQAARELAARQRAEKEAAEKLEAERAAAQAAIDAARAAEVARLHAEQAAAAEKLRAEAEALRQAEERKQAEVARLAAIEAQKREQEEQARIRAEAVPAPEVLIPVATRTLKIEPKLRPLDSDWGKQRSMVRIEGKPRKTSSP